MAAGVFRGGPPGDRFHQTNMSLRALKYCIDHVLYTTDTILLYFVSVHVHINSLEHIDIVKYLNNTTNEWMEFEMGQMTLTTYHSP